MTARSGENTRQHYDAAVKTLTVKLWITRGGLEVGVDIESDASQAIPLLTPGL